MCWNLRTGWPAASGGSLGDSLLLALQAQGTDIPTLQGFPRSGPSCELVLLRRTLREAPELPGRGQPWASRETGPVAPRSSQAQVWAWPDGTWVEGVESALWSLGPRWAVRPRAPDCPSSSHSVTFTPTPPWAEVTRILPEFWGGRLCGMPCGQGRLVWV